MLRGGLYRGGNRVIGGSAFWIARRIDMAIPRVVAVNRDYVSWARWGFDLHQG